MTDWAKLATEYWMSQPSPHAEGLTNGEFPTAVKLATQLKFGGHASPQEATAFWTEFKGMNERLVAGGKAPLSPEEFSHTADNLAKVSFTYHGRPPTMNEIAKHRDSEPAKINQFYADLPDELYPHVTAGEMVTALQKARPWAQQFLGREPNKLEAAYLHHSKDRADDYYRDLGLEKGSTWGGDPKAPPTGAEGQAGGSPYGGQSEPQPPPVDTSRGTGSRLGGERE